MSTPIYTDKDYLDKQFETLNDRLDRHEESHAKFWPRALATMTAAAAVAGVVLRLIGL